MGWEGGGLFGFFLRLENISFAGTRPSEQRQPTTFQPIRTDIQL